ncbi:MAG: ABC transporter ATP-binding protein, partial [Aquincola sp.]|nr:ABC transporter ATP-binding protein [Aquincola sp.]
MLQFFEKLVHPYPEAEPTLPPRRFFAFLWACTEGIRPWLLLMTLASGLIGAFEAGLFAMLGGVVDWLSGTAPHRLWAEQGHLLALLAAVMAASVLLVGLQSALKHQSMAGNFPMLLRWNFHRLMLGQSMHFYQDEFAGRIATKVMQTALAVRDTWMILCELMVF